MLEKVLPNFVFRATVIFVFHLRVNWKRVQQHYLQILVWKIHMDNSGINFWVLINFDQIALDGKNANVLTLINILIEWIQNQTFRRLNQYLSPCKLAIKFDIAFIVSGTITCLVYIKKCLRWINSWQILQPLNSHSPSPC